MLYVTLALWLFGLLLMGHGIYRLLGGIGRPAWVHWVLLPGSLVSAMGYIFGSLITGGEIRRASLMGGSLSGSGKGQQPASQGVAVTTGRGSKVMLPAKGRPEQAAGVYQEAAPAAEPPSPPAAGRGLGGRSSSQRVFSASCSMRA
ncbi:MAG: hypothetical protein WCK05_02195, partial [Planctomycetota bacterium]